MHCLPGSIAPVRKNCWFTRALGAMALAGASCAAVAHAPPSHPAPAHAARTMYRVTNLGNGEVIGEAKINASGQVAFSLAVERDAPLRSVFYDGVAFHDIGSLGAAFARVTGLNNAGQVAGVSHTPAGVIRGFFWSRSRGILDLGFLPTRQQTWEPAINNAGEVTGYATGDPLPYARAFRWTLASGIEDIGAFTSGTDSVSQATAINDAGLIAGISMTPAFDYHAFAWTRATGLVDIDTLGTRYSAPVAVGMLGQVAGNFFIDGGHTRGFLWTRATGMRDLGTGGRDDVWVTSMSPGGRVTGVVLDDGAYQQAMTWTRESGLVELGSFGGGVSSAMGANNRGQVVGAAATRGNEFHAFVWSAREGLVDLNRRLRRAPAGLTLHSATAISDSGVIVAYSNAGLVLLTPVCGCRHAAPHTVGPIAAPSLVKVGVPVEATVSFASENAGARHHVLWSFGDGSGERAGSASARQGLGRGAGSHTYRTPGIYTVTARVVDLAGKSVAVSRRITVHDPSGGVSAGAGAFMSPHAPNRAAPFQAGRASFSFIAPPTAMAKGGGATGLLLFNVGALHFRSTEIRQVGTHSGARQYVGSGRINGAGFYQFSMVAREGGAGHFGLKIWHTDPVTRAQVIDYDSQGARQQFRAAPVVDDAVALH